jgi:hypothetical protein
LTINKQTLKLDDREQLSFGDGSNTDLLSAGCDGRDTALVPTILELSSGDCRANWLATGSNMDQKSNGGKN